MVAGVIGRKKVIYDLWGESVNMASRMESHGHTGAVQITERTWNLVKDRFECQERGIVDVKGAGPTRVCHVLSDCAGARSPPPPVLAGPSSRQGFLKISWPPIRRQSTAGSDSA